MYFDNRSQAGDILARQLEDIYRYENCAVIALGEGGVLVGEQLAWRLHCVLMMLISEGIAIPGESMDFGAMSQSGQFTYNGSFTQGEIDGWTNEFHGYLEERKRESHEHMNRLLGDGGIIDKDMIRDRTVILVADGFGDNLTALDVALNFLKSVRTEKLVVAVPVVSVAAVDRLHVAVDEIHILDVKSNYMGTDHYYEDNALPDRAETVEKISQVILNWR